MPPNFVAPTFMRPSFTCIHCGVLSQMRWEDLYIWTNGPKLVSWTMCRCVHCSQESIWKTSQSVSGTMKKGLLAYPHQVSAPDLHEDLPAECRADFEEARLISTISPRGAAALLRLCLQKLLGQIGGTGVHIDNDIKALVKEGLDPHIQQALDVVRVTGNNAVHPLDMSPEDLVDYVPVMFDMINLIVEERIARQRRIAERFAGLPEKAKAAIERRDGSKG